MEARLANKRAKGAKREGAILFPKTKKGGGGAHKNTGKLLINEVASDVFMYSPHPFMPPPERERERERERGRKG